jgi:hypothetical protein
MTNKPITWDEVEAIFERCEGPLHVSRNIASGARKKRSRHDRAKAPKDEVVE